MKMRLTLLGMTLFAWLSAPQFRVSSARADEKRILVEPAYLSKYDIAVDVDLLFSHLLSPMFRSQDADDWEIVSDLRQRFTGWIDDALTAEKMADVLINGMPLEGQPLTKV